HIVINSFAGVRDDAVDGAAGLAEVRWQRAAEIRIDGDPGSDRSDETADGMDAKDVERIVIAECALHRRTKEEAHRACGKAKDERTHGTGKTRRRGDRDKTRDNARGKAEKARLTLEEPLHEEPGKPGCRGRHKSVRHGQNRARICLEV